MKNVKLHVGMRGNDSWLEVDADQFETGTISHMAELEAFFETHGYAIKYHTDDAGKRIIDKISIQSFDIIPPPKRK